MEEGGGFDRSDTGNEQRTQRWSERLGIGEMEGEKSGSEERIRSRVLAARVGKVTSWDNPFAAVNSKREKHCVHGEMRECEDQSMCRKLKSPVIRQGEGEL